MLVKEEITLYAHQLTEKSETWFPLYSLEEKREYNETMRFMFEQILLHLFKHILQKQWEMYRFKCCLHSVDWVSTASIYTTKVVQVWQISLFEHITPVSAVWWWELPHTEVCACFGGWIRQRIREWSSVRDFPKHAERWLMRAGDVSDPNIDS